MKTFMVAIIYAPILPIGLLIACIGIGMEYWIDKYMLLRRHSRPSRISDEIGDLISSLIPWVIFLYSLMLFIYMQYLFEDYEYNSNLSFMWMMIMLVYLALPLTSASKCCKKTEIELYR